MMMQFEAMRSGRMSHAGSPKHEVKLAAEEALTFNCAHTKTFQGQERLRRRKSIKC